MALSKNNFLTKLFAGELRVALSVFLVLLALGGLTWAVTSGGVEYRFDFGPTNESMSGYIAVSNPLYPKTSGTIQYGWSNPGNVMQDSAGGGIADLIYRNYDMGINPADFVISGLDDGNYSVNVASGSSTKSLGTKITANGQSYIVNTTVSDGGVKSAVFNVSVTNGKLMINFARSGQAMWGVNSLILASSNLPSTQPSFTVKISPISHQTKADVTAVYQINVNAINGFADKVALSVSGLTSGMSSGFAPQTATVPFTSDLSIGVPVGVPPSTYQFTVTAIGDDAAKTKVDTTISLVILSGSGSSNSIGNQISNSIDNSTITETPVVHTPEQMADAQEVVDKFVAAEKAKLPDQTNLKDIDKLPQAIIFPSVTGLPQATNPFEGALQKLTGASIITAVLDTAPAAEVAPPPRAQSFLGKLFSSLFTPVL